MSKKSKAQQNQAQKFPFVPRSVLLMAVEKKDKKKSGNGSKEVIIKSIAGFLESNGFKKTLSMLLLETKIEENSWKSSVNLDDIFSKFVDSCNDEEPASIEEPETLNVEEEEEPKKETKEKKKKKKSSDKEAEKVEQPIEEIKEKKKKKNKKQKDEINHDNENNNVKETIKDDKKKKEKKKEKKKDEQEIDEIKEFENVKDHEEAKQNDGEIEEKKVSKKRKKPDSDENDENATEMENGNDETKSGKKDKSSEPKTANAFKRVKIEEVKFADERLTDNSYWAKGGANSGYGAKAQQILEQVRGRGFRHEKTKKKRGSYRGGQIDLDSHSIKFNYSEEE